MFSKLKNLKDKYGAKETLRMLARFVKISVQMHLGPRAEDRDAIEALLFEIRAGAYERIVLRRGSFGWAAPLFQRAQQLARAMGRRGCLVLYEAAPPHDRLRGVQRLDERLWLVNFRSPRLRREIERAAAESGRARWVMLASPESRLPPRLFRRYDAAGWRIVYDYIDALSGEISGGGCVPRRTRALYTWAMVRRDVLVTASSLALLRDARLHGRDAWLVENGVDCAHFSVPSPCPEDGRFRALLEEGKPIVCYYGALARWLDYECMRRIAADGRFILLLIGVKYDGSFDGELGERENVVFLGPRPYETLPAYAARCDVLLIPFQRSEVGDAASPVKLFEYLALGKPIVALDVAECRRCRSVLLAAGASDAVRRVEEALALRRDAAYLAGERREALAADWLRRAETLQEALRCAEKREKA